MRPKLKVETLDIQDDFVYNQIRKIEKRKKGESK